MDKNDYRSPSSAANRRLSQDDFQSMSHEELQALSSEELRAFFLGDLNDMPGNEPERTAPQFRAEPNDIDLQMPYFQDESDAPISNQPEPKPIAETKKKSRVMGLCAFGFLLLSALTLMFIFGNALLSYVNKDLGMSEIQLLVKGIVVAGVAAGIAFLIAFITYFVKRQKKGFAVVSTIFSLLIIFVSGFAVYAYQYMFGAISQDNAFNSLSNEELHIVQTQDDGEIVRENTLPVATVGRDEIESIVGEQQNTTPGQEIEWEHLGDEDIPEEALEKMNSGAPTGKSYLTGDHKNILNFALFGLDEVGSSDSIMIFSLDKVHHKIKLISIPRDSYVQVPAWGSYAKLAYPYVWGGPQWAVGTINHNFAMNVTEYISVDMNQLKDIIDLVGGVEVDIDTQHEVNVMYNKGYYDINWGKCRLNGAAAVAYARIRDDSEANRTGRQREVLISILNTIKTKSWTEYPEFVRACLGMCTTSFDNEQLLELCAEVLQNNYTIEQYALIEQMDYWGGKIGQEQYFYVVYDLNRASDKLYRMIYEDLYISGYTD